MQPVDLLRGVARLEGLRCGEEGSRRGGVGWLRDEVGWRLGVGDVT